MSEIYANFNYNSQEVLGGCLTFYRLQAQSTPLDYQ